VASRSPSKFILPLGLEICLVVSYFRKSWKNAIDEAIDAAICVLSKELREIVRGKGRKHCTVAFDFIVVTGCWIFQKPSDPSYTSKNLTTSSLLHLDTIFNETAVQNKHSKGGGEHEP